jgi:valyl-tRNA synthetase
MSLIGIMIFMSTAYSNDSLPRSYTPAESEPQIRELWREAQLGHTEAPPPGTPCYSIVLPPPNVTAALHLGHALNSTLQDILVRYHRMQGDATLWMPGTDHAGIATQTVVEKRLLQSGQRRIDMSREAFVDLTQEWKDEYEKVILGQLGELGASCDWDRTRFTMDPMCTAAVRYAFFHLFQDGLIERGKRLVNWDPATQTALADDEVEMEEVAGHMWYLKYPLEDGSGHITVATTRPETMLGDTAVAMNPNDPRAEQLRGKFITLPIVGRRIPLVEDDYVIMAGSGDDPKAKYATGFLKVTPAHDQNDWDIGQRHDLEPINILAPDGSISDRHGWEDVSSDAAQLVGLSREDARIAVVDWFKAAGLLEEIRPYSHSVGHSYRSHVPIEPYLSDQWYVRVTDDRLRGEALRAMDPEQVQASTPARTTGDAASDGGLTFAPARYAKTFEHWHQNLRDWCISRQLWWGHRIPVWTLELPVPAEHSLPAEPLSIAPKDCGLPLCDLDDAGVCIRLTVDQADGVVRILACVNRNRPDLEEQFNAAGFAQDPDVLDTWFSSALWPMSTMGWPDETAFPETNGLLDAFNPTNVLCTAREIITLWVSRMVMFNRYFLNGRLPFKEVYIHPMVQDGHGQKMSKSLGNGVDPRDIIHSHGTDALRFVMAQIATETQDVRLSVDLVDPHSGETFTPEFIETAAGHKVAAPIQKSPADPTKEMVTVYGTFSGEVPTDERPLAMNTSNRFDVGRNFANKVWNAARFAMGRVESPEPVAALCDLSLADRWMLSRIESATTAIGQSIEQYRFNACTEAIYDIVWRDFCDWYLEAIKPTISNNRAQQRVLLSVIDALLRLMHPLCAYVTEAIWPHMQALGERGVPGLNLQSADVLALAAWPEADSSLRDEQAETDTTQLQSLVSEIRRARSDNDVPVKADITLCAPAGLFDLASDSQPVLESMCRVAKVEATPNVRPAAALAFAFDGEEVLLDLAGAIDPEVERKRLQTKATDLTKKVGSMNGRLSNESYIKKAPAHLVEDTRSQLQQAVADLEATNAAIEALH